MHRFNVKTGILLIVLFSFASGLPFDKKVPNSFEFDDESGGSEVKKFLTRLRRTPHYSDDEEGSIIEARFGGGYHGHPHHGETGYHGHLHYLPPVLWHHHGPSMGHPFRDGGIGAEQHYCNHDNYGSSQEYYHHGHSPGYPHEHDHHHFMADHHHCNHGPGQFPDQQPWNPNGGNGNNYPGQKPHVYPGTIDKNNGVKPQDRPNMDDKGGKGTPGNGPTTEKTTAFPEIDIREIPEIDYDLRRYFPYYLKLPLVWCLKTADGGRSSIAYWIEFQFNK